jgi:hypothetical protein
MTQGDQLGAFLGCLNTGNARHRHDVTLGHCAVHDGSERYSLHTHATRGRRLTSGDSFLSDIDNVRPSRIVEMGKAI